jgi:hypothetical protein
MFPSKAEATLGVPENNRMAAKACQDKQSSLFIRLVSDKEKSFKNLTSGANVLKLFTAIRYEFSN